VRRIARAGAGAPAPDPITPGAPNKRRRHLPPVMSSLLWTGAAVSTWDRRHVPTGGRQHFSGRRQLCRRSTSQAASEQTDHAVVRWRTPGGRPHARSDAETPLSSAAVRLRIRRTCIEGGDEVTGLFTRNVAQARGGAATCRPAWRGKQRRARMAGASPGQPPSPEGRRDLRAQCAGVAYRGQAQRDASGCWAGVPPADATRLHRDVRAQRPAPCMRCWSPLPPTASA
jgi:hypothetical protein